MFVFKLKADSWSSDFALFLLPQQVCCIDRQQFSCCTAAQTLLLLSSVTVSFQSVSLSVFGHVWRHISLGLYVKLQSADMVLW